MIVWVIEQGHYYEGSDVIGVYADESKALARVIADHPQLANADPEWWGEGELRYRLWGGDSSWFVRLISREVHGAPDPE